MSRKKIAMVGIGTVVISKISINDKVIVRVNPFKRIK